MKNLFKKSNRIFVVIFLLFSLISSPLLVKAATERESYRTNKENSNPNEVTNIITKVGSSTIINRSDKDFFVPNNTAAEYTAWSKNAPNYVTVSVCGDGVCSEGEDNSNCFSSPY